MKYLILLTLLLPLYSISQTNTLPPKTNKVVLITPYAGKAIRLSGDTVAINNYDGLANRKPRKNDWKYLSSDTSSRIVYNESMKDWQNIQATFDSLLLTIHNTDCAAIIVSVSENSSTAKFSLPECLESYSGQGNSPALLKAFKLMDAITILLKK